MPAAAEPQAATPAADEQPATADPSTGADAVKKMTHEVDTGDMFVQGGE